MRISHDPATDVHDLLDEQEEDYDWVIPGMICRDERLIFTGPEGGGKSTLVKQIGVQTGQGIHPWTLEPMTPITILIFDVENSRRQNRYEYRKLFVNKGLSLAKPDYLHVVCAPEGIDLSDTDDYSFVQKEIQSHNPDLVIMGPLYKMSTGDPSAVTAMLPLAHKLDLLRTRYSFALIIEAHSPHEFITNAGKVIRPSRPIGWSGWLRWPDFGFCVHNNGEVTHWRGPRDAERYFPSALSRGGLWPWEDDKYGDFAKMCTYAQSIHLLPSTRQIESALGISKSKANNLIKANQTAWDSLDLA